MSYKHPPGAVNWRFRFSDKLIYITANKEALRFYFLFRDKKTFTVERRDRSNWEFVVENIPADICGCGRPYALPNGEPFKFQENPLVQNMKTISKTMQSPVLCQICYYRKEISKGRWAPKAVRRELGLED